jgi:secreted trypsin-like serine protease
METCGGTLIGPDIVLYAAHCGDYSGRQVNVGAFERSEITGGAQPRFVVDCRFDPLYPGVNEYNYDYAVCKLDSPVEIDEDEVRLKVNNKENVPKEDDELIVLGLGVTEIGFPQFLMYVEVEYVTNDECNDEEKYGGTVQENEMCAASPGKDSCQGDSGGPLVKRNAKNDGSFVDKHVGIVR